MLMALREGLVLSLAGQFSTHKLQPVQSSGDIWIVNFLPGNSLKKCASMDLNVAGAFINNSGSYNFWRITACGQT